MQSKAIMEQWELVNGIIAELVTTQEASRRTGLTDRQVRNRIRLHQLPGGRVGRAWLVYAPALADVVKSSKGRPVQGTRKTRRKTRAQTP